MVITGLSSFGWWGKRWWVGEWEENAEAEGVHWSSLCTSTSILPPSSYSSAGWAVSVLWPAHGWSPRGQKMGSNETHLCGHLTVLWGWALSGNVFPTLCHRYQPSPKGPVWSWPVCLAEADGWAAGRLWWGGGRCMIFDEGNGCQLFAELLQHNHPFQQSHVINGDALRLQT